jgi:hypothetical protein
VIGQPAADPGRFARLALAEAEGGSERDRVAEQAQRMSHWLHFDGE